jgi:outer membrane protein TolC
VEPNAQKSASLSVVREEVPVEPKPSWLFGREEEVIEQPVPKPSWLFGKEKEVIEQPVSKPSWLFDRSEERPAAVSVKKKEPVVEVAQNKEKYPSEPKNQLEQTGEMVRKYLQQVRARRKAEEEISIEDENTEDTGLQEDKPIVNSGIPETVTLDVEQPSSVVLVVGKAKERSSSRKDILSALTRTDFLDIAEQAKISDFPSWLGRKRDDEWFSDLPVEKIVNFGLDDLVKVAVERNAGAIFQNMQRLIASHTADAEKSVLDTDFFFNFRTSGVHEKTGSQDIVTRQNPEYREKGETFETGVKHLHESGTEWRLVVTHDRKNSSVIEQFRDFDNEYRSGTALTVRRPVRKGRGENVVMLKHNIALSNMRLAEDEYRKMLMDLIGLTIQSYWRFYVEQELYKSWQETLKVAEEQFDHVNRRFKSGLSSEEELLEAQAAVYSRQLELSAVRARILQIYAQLLNTLSLSASENKALVFRMVDEPEVEKLKIPSLEESFTLALKNWPEFRLGEEKLRQEKLRQEYAKNQLLPQLDLVGNVRSNPLETSPSKALGRLISDEFVSWYMGFEYSIPMGNTAARSGKFIADARVQQAELELEYLYRSLNNGLFEKITQMASLQERMIAYEKIIEVKKKQIAMARERVMMGKGGLKDFFEEQEKLIGNQRQMLSSVVELKLAEAALEKAVGKLLDRFDIKLKGLDEPLALPSATLVSD